MQDWIAKAISNAQTPGKEYLEVILNNSPEIQKSVLWTLAKHVVPENEQHKIIKLLEMQRYTMLMYTSCGWFFDDISGLEAVQVLQYAARAMQLAKDATGIVLEDEFLKRLASAKSNIPDMENAHEVIVYGVQHTEIVAKLFAAYINLQQG